MNTTITAFEPFDGPRNVSADLLALLEPKLMRSNFGRVYTEVLPCASVKLSQRIQQILAERKPHIWLLLGQSQRSEVELEQGAVNLKAFRIPDLVGYQPTAERIAPTAPERLSTTVPRLEQIVDELNRTGFSCRLSNDAGTYLCNQAYFEVLAAAELNGVCALFVHLPARASPADLMGIVEAILVNLVSEVRR